jgi:hypothetical protein
MNGGYPPMIVYYHRRSPFGLNDDGLPRMLLVCDRCGGPHRILGAVTEPDAVRRLLAALGLAAEPPPGRPVPAA